MVKFSLECELEDDGRWLAEQIRGAKVVELEAAHLSNVERSEEFNVAVATFLGGD